MILLKQILARLHFGLAALLHKIIGELAKALEERTPRIIVGQEDDSIAHFLNINFAALKAELFGQAYRLAVSILKEFCRLHGRPFLP